MASIVPISSPLLRAEISSTGAELVRLQDSAGADLLWDGDPAFWTGRSPLLFPMVGRARGDRIMVAGRAYEMGQHGFARTSTFTPVRSDAASCTWRLEASEETRRLSVRLPARRHLSPGGRDAAHGGRRHQYG
jgi:galactose mutarotase-like enzyme